MYVEGGESTGGAGPAGGRGPSPARSGDAGRVSKPLSPTGETARDWKSSPPPAPLPGDAGRDSNSTLRLWRWGEAGRVSKPAAPSSRGETARDLNTSGDAGRVSKPTPASAPAARSGDTARDLNISPSSVDPEHRGEAARDTNASGVAVPSSVPGEEAPITDGGAMTGGLAAALFLGLLVWRRTLGGMVALRPPNARCDRAM